MAEELSLNDFAACKGDTFQICPEGLAPLPAVLVEARSLGGQSERREPFSLLLRGPREPVLAQRIHRVEHERLGALDIFLVPVGLASEGEEGMLYEAVFN